MKQKMFFLFRAALFLLGFVLVAYGMVFFGQHLGSFRDYFLRSGKWPEAIALVIISFAIGYVLKKLLLWEYRKEAGIKRRRR